MVRPAPEPREITIDLPDELIESLGTGAELLAHYLTVLADVGVNDPANHPPPLPVLCRICERQITPWWFEKHSELCLQEYRAEMDVQLSNETLSEHRNAIVKVLDALEARKGRPTSAETTVTPQPEYKGLPIGPSSNSTSGSDSGRMSPATPPRSREASSSGLGHSRARSFAVRRPLERIVELILDLCDTALEIQVPAIKETRSGPNGEFRAQSPQSESRIAQVADWQTPGANTLDQEQGLAALNADTETFSRAKVDAVMRHRVIIEYSEKLRVESHALVIECIDAAMAKTASIVAGNLSDSSTEGEEELNGDTEEERRSAARESLCSMGTYDGGSAMSNALRNVSNPSLRSQFERRNSIAPSSVAPSSRSSSPMECPTPRSHAQSQSAWEGSASVSKRGSMYIESEFGDSDSNFSAVMSNARRVDSPGADRSHGRSTSISKRNKRRSLRLPHMPSPHRQPSPARANVPQSPVKATNPRLSTGLESLPSPITSPLLSNTEYSSPIVSAHRHRRQSSATSSAIDGIKPPGSPRLQALSHPQVRAVPTSIKDFEIIKPISKGAFGSVYLSKKKSTGDYFAIKVLKKADMVAKNQVTNVKAERAIMMWQGESDFVAKLYWTFSSKDYLYLVMEYLNGGDCASLIKSLGGLSEDWAKKYLAEVILGVEHLHSREIVHRDLKPDNLLIDHKGHLKLTDFGLSRMGLIGRQKRHLKSPNDSTPDLLKTGPFVRATSLTSSRSASFDFQGLQSPSSTPLITPDITGPLGQPSYFNLNKDNNLGREHSRRKSGYRSDSGSSDTFSAMFRNFSLNDELPPQRGPPIEEETQSEGAESPDPYILHPVTSQHRSTPPMSGMLPPPMALFDPDDHNRRFVGTPDYLAPETINGLGQDEISDWWSLGCILFEFLYGYPPFHAETPDKVFENILTRKIDWPDPEECPISAEAMDLIERLTRLNPKERLGANVGGKYKCGGEQIRKHPWFADDINWETLLEDEAQFVPAPQHAEDTEYFDARGAKLQTFAEELEDQGQSPAVTPGAELQDRPHDALSRPRNPVGNMKRGLMPLHIPAHVRDTRSRRLSEPVANDDFGSFAFKNLPVLEKANKDVLQKLRAEAAHKPTKVTSAAQSPIIDSPGPSLEGSPLLLNPLQRAKSTNKGHRPSSPSGFSQAAPSPSRPSQPTSPLLVSFSTGQNQERRKTSSASSSLSHQSSASLQPGNFFDVPKLPSTLCSTPSMSSPIKSARLSTNMSLDSPKEGVVAPRPMSMSAITRVRSQTVGSQEGDMGPPPPVTKPLGHHKRRSQVFDVSPSSSDNEDPRAKALLRVQRRRQSSRHMSQLPGEGASFRPLDVLIAEDNPITRTVMEKLLEKLSCRVIAVANGAEAARIAMSDVQFDIIMMEYKLPQINGTDVARLIRDTKNANTQTPLVAVTGYLKELPQMHHFDSLIEKPPHITKFREALCALCQWRPAPPGFTPQAQHAQPIMPSNLRKESRHTEDSPSSVSSGPFARQPGSLYRQSSREHSIGSSFYGDTDSTNTEDVPVIIHRDSEDWQAQQPPSGLNIIEEPQSLPTSRPFFHPGLPHLLHHNSAPPTMTDSRTPRKQRSVEAVKAKRETLEKRRHECAESGDDEDELLGNVQVRARSPQGKQPRSAGQSKLGVEMMRTNSRGSVTSVYGGDQAPLSSSTTASKIATLPEVIEQLTLNPKDEKTKEKGGLTPPEVFSRNTAGDDSRTIVDKSENNDVDATPRPSTTSLRDVANDSNVDGAKTVGSNGETDIDVDQTPRPSTTTVPTIAARRHEGDMLSSHPPSPSPV